MAARWGHVAAGVEGKVYVWGGRRRYNKVSHDGPDKTEIIFSVNILDVKVSVATTRFKCSMRRGGGGKNNLKLILRAGL